MKLTQELKDKIDKMSEEELEKYFPQSTVPKGWVSIDDHLPKFKALDFHQGYSVYSVKDREDNEFESRVSDHGMWEIYAREVGITHWFNS